MARRALSPDEAASLGLDAPTPQRRALSTEEAQGLGLVKRTGIAGLYDDAVSGLNEVIDKTPDAVRAFTHGASKRYMDEGVGALESAFPRLALEPQDFFNPNVPTPEAKTYADARDAERQRIEQSKQRLPAGVGTGLEVVGDIATDVAMGNPGASYAGAATLGAVSGLGASEADLTKGDIGGAVLDTASGTAMGLIGKAVGDEVADRGGQVRNWVLRRAAAGKQAASDTAQAMAERDVGQVINGLRGEAGGAASRAANVISNIDEIDLPTDVPRRTVGELRDAIADQMQTLRQAADEARAKAIASGINPDDLGVGRMGEFLAKGSKMDAAQKAASRIPAYEAAIADLREQLSGLGQRAADEVLPDTAQALREAQAALKQDPRFLDLKQNVLKNSLSDFDEAAAAAVGRREAYQQAMSARPEAVASRADALLSGRAAREQIQQRLQRYGAPLVGTLFGAGAGAAFGVATGADAGESALYALGGAGARPALRSFKNLLQSPAVRNAGWSSLEALARSAPESFGRWSQSVAQALARGPGSLAAMDKVLRDTDPEWRQLREQQEKAAQR